MKRYHDMVGDGGSGILEQVAEQRTRITDGLAGVRHLVAVGSGKGGVGKSTLTLHLAGALRARGLRIAILDADFNGPSQARMAGVQGALFVPGSHKVSLPRTTNGIAVFSMGSVIPESEALEFESAAQGESHTWRAIREFALLGEILSGYYCRDCNAIKPLFASPEPFDAAQGGPSSLRIPCLGTVPFDPELARHCDRGFPLAELPDTPVGRALDHVAQQLLDNLE